MATISASGSRRICRQERLLLTNPEDFWWPTHKARFAKLVRYFKNLCCQANSNSSQLGRHHVSLGRRSKGNNGLSAAISCTRHERPRCPANRQHQRPVLSPRNDSSAVVSAPEDGLSSGQKCPVLTLEMLPEPPQFLLLRQKAESNHRTARIPTTPAILSEYCRP